MKPTDHALVPAITARRAPIGRGQPGAGFDPESRAWIDRLGASGSEHRSAIDDLHDLLLKAARFEVNRRRAIASQPRDNAGDDLAHQAAADALVTVLSKLRLEPDPWALFMDNYSTSRQDVETADLLAALQDAIEHDLSPLQRDVLVATTLNGVPNRCPG